MTVLRQPLERPLKRLKMLDYGKKRGKGVVYGATMPRRHPKPYDMIRDIRYRPDLSPLDNSGAMVRIFI